MLRRAYASWMETRPRLASFWATTNQRYVLTDTTGSRRFFPVVLKQNLDLHSAIDYRQFYAQAIAELDEERLKTWFTQEENRRIEEHNRPFCADLRLHDLVEERYERSLCPSDRCTDALAEQMGYLTAQEVWDDLVRVDPELMARFSEHQFGAKLKSLGAQALRTERRRRYNLRRRPTPASPTIESLLANAQ